MMNHDLDGFLEKKRASFDEKAFGGGRSHE